MYPKRFISFILLLSLGLAMSACSKISLKELTLNAKASTVNFVSVKKGTIGETHVFTNISGEIIDGQARLMLKADSVESNVEIRNQRMQEFLFETDKFPTIAIEANVASALEKLKTQDSIFVQVPATVILHGISQEVMLDTYVSKTQKGLVVATAKPAIIKASDFGLESGLAKLSELVNNLEIAQTVPVSFVLTFD